ncbi:MAG: GNAT family N-acetyltransferase [Oscillospiraceae bacterium]|nr:GNAT family N-acetyltransferase [Oscillospiraceae bacterium]
MTTKFATNAAGRAIKKKIPEDVFEVIFLLNKSVPFVKVLMKRKAGIPVPEASLPDGFKFVFFKAGDEKYWAEIEASVLEFDSEQQALEYFRERFLPHLPELEKRCIFVENARGEKISTSMAWYDNFYPHGEIFPWLHWVAVKPEAQGLGLGKAASAKAAQLLLEINGDTDFYLGTQTWSHKAVGIYEKLGWEMTYMQNIRHYSRVNYEKAKKIIKRIRRAKR